MRLGLVMLGTGAYAAANVGVMQELEERHIMPYAACGMHAGAWPAALYARGMNAADMSKALQKLRRACRGGLCAQGSSRALLGGRKTYLSDGAAINRLLRAQAGEQLLALCERRAIFPCRVASCGRRVVFSTQAYAQGRDVTLTMQASVSFAARAAMANPPFLSPMPWLGSALLAEEDISFACGQLLSLGVDRVLIVEPRAAMAHAPDALELCSAHRRWALEGPLPAGVGVLRVAMPEGTGALAFNALDRIVAAGETAASAQLDHVLRGMGMSLCRVLPFRARSARG